MVASIIALVSIPVGADAQSTDDKITQTRAAIDSAAQRWFESREEAAQLDADIAELEHKVADAKQHADRTAVTARARALEIYKGSGTDIEPLLASDNALDSVRRAELLDRANAESQHAIDALEAASEEFTAQRETLEQTRADHAAVVQRLADEQASLEAQLDGLEVQAQREAAAAKRAQEQASRSSSGASTASPTKRKAPANPAPANVPPPPAPGGTHPHHDDPFLACTRARESRGNYGVVSGNGMYYGAYQFSRTTWNSTASHAGRLELVGVAPNQASVYDQDDLAWVLYQWQGKGPWGGRC